MDLKFESILTMSINTSLGRNSITPTKSNSVISSSSRPLSIIEQTNPIETPIMPPLANDQLDPSVNNSDHQTTLDLLEKIRQTAHAELIGPMPLSLQVC